MLEFDWQELRKWSGGEWIKLPFDEPVRGFSFDSRSLKAGEMFVALKTPKRDGHSFIEVAKAKGASAALVSACCSDIDLPQLLVDDTLVGLGDLARGYRDESSATVVGVTGSCGKTTFKDLLYYALGGKPNAWRTQGNLNNRIGVPITLLGMPIRNGGYGIIEAGISEPGEMECLAKIIDPDIAVVTSIGPAHLEGLGSLRGIAVEKGRLAVGGKAGKVYLGESCQPYLEELSGGLDYAIVAEGLQGEGVKGFRQRIVGGMTRISLEGFDDVFEIGGIGKGLASNVAMAITLALDLGVDSQTLKERLKLWRPSKLRGEWKTMGKARVYLDCYNANPLSMLDGLETFNRLSSQTPDRIFVMGSMEELGDSSDEWHERVGSSMELRNGDLVLLIGDGAQAIKRGLGIQEDGERVELIESVDQIGRFLSGFSGDIFLKGSRRYGLESAIRFLEQPVERVQASC
jgi:UDP-N-acetylmuramoyl-tripeptide--D-alanyl-D-alanine ligase